MSPPRLDHPQGAAPAWGSAAADKVVLLDRDGTIVVDRNYLADPVDLEFLPGAAQGLRQLYRQGYRLVVISNQSGVGRGLFSLERLAEVNARLARMVQEVGAELAGIYCCPHRPEERCACRKPQTQLVARAAQELGFDARAAIVVGDKPSDIELGRRLGAITILITGSAHSPAYAPADHVVGDLLQAARLIRRLEGRTAT